MGKLNKCLHLSCACSVRGCTVPEASASCRSRLRTYHSIILFLGPMKAPRAGVMGRVVGGPAGSGALAWPQRECLGAHPTPAGSWSRGDRFVFPGRSFFFSGLRVVRSLDVFFFFFWATEASRCPVTPTASSKHSKVPV